MTRVGDGPQGGSEGDGMGRTRCPLSPNPDITPMTRSDGDGRSDRSDRTDSSVAADGHRISSALGICSPNEQNQTKQLENGVSGNSRFAG